MSFFGLFGHDKNPAAAGALSSSALQTLPTSQDAPDGLTGGLVSGYQMPGIPTSPVQIPQLPAAPPVQAKAPSLFDKDHRPDTLLAIGTGLLSGFNFGDGVANVGKNLLAERQQMKQDARKSVTYGGPDDAFQITTDPVTGAQSVSSVPAFQEYLAAKREKPKDTADLNGRVMYAIGQLPADQQAAAFEDVKANPDHYGIDGKSLPDSWSPLYGTVLGNIGMTVSQAMTRRQQAERDAHNADFKQQAADDRTRRTDIYADRSAAQTSQGAARVAQGAQRVAQGEVRVGLAQNADRRATAKASGSTVLGGYEYRRDPITGAIQKRKVQ